MLIVYAHCVILLAKIKTVIVIEEYVPLTAIYAYTVSPCFELLVIIGIKKKCYQLTGNTLIAVINDGYCTDIMCVVISQI